MQMDDTFDSCSKLQRPDCCKAWKIIYLMMIPNVDKAEVG